MKVGNAATLVVFGATGDLFTKKVVPSLLRLMRERRLPKHFRVVGFGRSELTDEGFRDLVAEILKKRKERVGTKEIKKFLLFFTYIQGTFDDAKSFVALREELALADEEYGTISNKVFYLAIPPQLFGVVLKNVATTVLRRSRPTSDKHIRLMVEKPFGKDGASSRKLDALIHTYFSESEIYRIDHYLAKRVLSALPFLKKKHALLDKALEKATSVDVRLLESVGVEHRGHFYESVGALRDVGQNHLLIKIALAFMRAPKAFTSESIRSARAAVLEYLPVLNKNEVVSGTKRAQYHGYRDIHGVHSESTVETYFAVTSTFKNGPFKGIPFRIESGKRLGSPLKEIRIGIKGGGYVHIQLEPKMTVVFESKGKRKVLLDLKNNKRHEQYTEEYSELIADAVAGDQTRFLSSKEVELMWRFIDPIQKVWAKGNPKLFSYTPDTKIDNLALNDITVQ